MLPGWFARTSIGFKVENGLSRELSFFSRLEDWMEPFLARGVGGVDLKIEPP